MLIVRDKLTLEYCTPLLEAANDFQQPDTSEKAAERFGQLSESVKNGIYQEFSLVQFFPRGTAADAFCEATPQEKAQAIYNYFLRDLIGLLSKDEPTAMYLFSKLPQAIKNNIYGELFHIKSFKTPYWRCAEHAFHHQYDQSSTPAEKEKAIESYLKSTLIVRFDDLPDEIKMKILGYLKTDEITLLVLRSVCTWMRGVITIITPERKNKTEAAKGGVIPFNLPASKEFAAALAGRGYFSLLKWARNNGCPWDERTCAKAAAFGHLEILKWARNNGCPWDKYTCVHATKFGHLENLKWARDNGCPWDEWTCTAAAACGHLEILKWARNNGCPWDKYTCYNAVKYGHFEVLKWARGNGCPWDVMECIAAVCDQAMIKIALYEGKGDKAGAIAIAEHYTAITKWMREQS